MRGLTVEFLNGCGRRGTMARVELILRPCIVQEDPAVLSKIFLTSCGWLNIHISASLAPLVIYQAFQLSYSIVYFSRSKAPRLLEL
jgi:hypothetical protein